MSRLPSEPARFATVPLDRLLPPHTPMRDEEDPQQFEELVADVRVRGVRSPILVTVEGDCYRTVYGDRRRRAALAAGLLEVPVRVEALSRLEQLEEMVVENLLRADPPPLKAGAVFAAMLEEHGLTVEEVAHRVNKSPAYVATRLRALRLPDDVKAALRAGTIGLTVALALGKCLVDADREYFLYHAISGGAAAAVVERWVLDRNEARRAAPPEGLPAPVGAPVAAERELSAVCEWHRGAVPLDKTITLRLCGDCYSTLLQVRDQVAAQDRAAGAGGTREGSASS